MNKQITIDELITLICEHEFKSYGSRIKPVDYYLSWNHSLLVIVNNNGDRLYYDYYKFLKNRNLELKGE